MVFFGDRSAEAEPLDSPDSRALLRAISDSLLDPQVLLEAVRASDGRVVDFVYRELNRATCDYLGLSREYLLGSGLLEASPGVAGAGLFDAYVRCVDTGEPVIIDDLVYDNEILSATRRYDLRATQVTPTSISLTWRDVTESRGVDARYRRLFDSSAIGMGTFSSDGTFQTANPAMCAFFGYDEETLRAMNWQELTARDYLDADLENVRAMLAGQVETYRMEKQYIHADGDPIWGDLSVSCLRSADGKVETFISQIIDITAAVASRRLLEERDEQNRALARTLRIKADRLAAELRSAAAYVASILPGDLDGPVHVTSRYLPSQELAGDSFDYRWIDDDHLIVYLIDVSGHGISPALLSVSVHNLLRSGSLPLATLLAPDEVLTELNRLFQMDQHDGNYFTMWFGVYEASSHTLHYANAGAPPAFAISAGPDATVAKLSTDGQPVGMFDNTVYASGSYTVPPGSRIFVFSDGAYEHTLDDGRQSTLADFSALAARLAGSSLDDLVDILRNLTPSEAFDDDCSIVRLDFD